MLAIQFVPSLTYVFVCFAFYGVFMSMFWPPLMAWLSGEHEGRELTRRFARYNLMWSFGSIVSPYVCGELAEHSARYPMAVGTGIFFLTAAFVGGAAMVLPRDAAQSGDFSEACEPVGDGVVETPLRYPAWAGMFAGFFAFGALLAVFPLAAERELFITDGTVGLLFLTRALFSTALFLIIGRTSRWHFKFSPMLSVQLIGVACFVLLTFFADIMVTALLFGLLGIVMAFSYSVSIFHGASGSSNRIKRMAIHESTLSFGLIAGSAAGGMLYETSAVRQVYLMCAAVFVLILAFQLILYMLFCRRGIQH
jgi:DHA1 family multidrug resistance protein-like MFS transporter/DHA1 family quinolone resistance protein-like MFS transporter